MSAGQMSAAGTEAIEIGPRLNIFYICLVSTALGFPTLLKNKKRSSPDPAFRRRTFISGAVSQLSIQVGLSNGVHQSVNIPSADFQTQLCVAWLQILCKLGFRPTTQTKPFDSD